MDKLEISDGTPSALPLVAAPKSRSTASSPFNNICADLILRSSDLVDFYVRRSILIEASPVFASILSLPQPRYLVVQDAEPLPVVDLAEDHKTIDALLRICYPIVKVQSKRSLEELELAIRAAGKYEMALPLDIFAGELCAAADGSPLQVWAIACRTHLEKAARRAAQMTLGTATLDVKCLGPMEGITAGEYYRLLEFRRLEGNVDSTYRLLTPPSLYPPDDPDLDISPYDFLTGIPHPDIVCRSSDGVDFRVHKGIISAASPVLRDMLADLEETYPNDAYSTSAKALLVAGTGPGTPQLPTLIIGKSARLLAPLLHSCYPGAIALPSDPFHFVDILLAFKGYEMQRIFDDACSHWEPVARSTPVQAYLAAANSGLNSCARQAAKHVLKEPLDDLYVPQMEDSTACSYHALLEYYRSCRNIALQSLEAISRSVAVHKSCRKDNPLLDMYLESYIRVESVHDSTSNVAWLQSYTKSLSSSAKLRPGSFAPDAQSVFHAATSAKTWCRSCQTHAENLVSLGSSLCEASTLIHKVSLVL